MVKLKTEDAEFAAAAKLYDEVVGSVSASLKAMGISTTRELKRVEVDGIEYSSDGEPQLPDDVTRLDLAQFGKLFGVFTSYLAYLSSLLTVTDMERTVSKSVLNMIKAKVRQECEGSQGEKEDYVMTDPRYIRFEVRFLADQGKYNSLKDRYEQFSIYHKFLSRELERRKAELDQSRMDGSLNRKLDRVRPQGNSYEQYRQKIRSEADLRSEPQEESVDTMFPSSHGK